MWRKLARHGGTHYKKLKSTQVSTGQTNTKNVLHETKQQTLETLETLSMRENARALPKKTIFSGTGVES